MDRSEMLIFSCSLAIGIFCDTALRILMSLGYSRRHLCRDERCMHNQMYGQGRAGDELAVGNDDDELGLVLRDVEDSVLLDASK